MRRHVRCVRRLRETVSRLRLVAVTEKRKPDMSARIPLNQEKIAEFCKKWKITEFALFGSVLREDFRPDSDVDVLVSFASDARWSLFDHIDIEEELSLMLGRNVDLVSRRAIERSENWIRRKAILTSAEPIYVAR